MRPAGLFRHVSLHSTQKYTERVWTRISTVAHENIADYTHQDFFNALSVLTQYEQLIYYSLVFVPQSELSFYCAYKQKTVRAFQYLHFPGFSLPGIFLSGSGHVLPFDAFVIKLIASVWVILSGVCTGNSHLIYRLPVYSHPQGGIFLP